MRALNPVLVLLTLTGRFRKFLLGLLLAAIAGAAGAADIPASPVFYGFSAGTVNVYAEIAGQKAIIVFSCAGSNTSQVQVNESFSESWSARIRGNGTSLTRSQFRIFGSPGKGGNNCDFPDPGSYPPVATREEAIRKSGLNLSTVGEYADFHSKAHGQSFVMAPTAQPVASAGSQPRGAEASATNLRDLLARFEEEGSKSRRSFFALSIGADSIYAEVVNDKAIVVRSCRGEVRSWVNPSMSGSWEIVFSSSGALSWRGTLERDRFRLFSPTSGSFASFPCTYSAPAQLGSTRNEALAIAKLDLAAVPDYSLFLAQAYGPRTLVASEQSPGGAAQSGGQSSPLASASAQANLKELLAKAEIESRQREAVLRAEEQKRLKDALARAEQDRLQREAQLKAETDRRIAEALARADDDRRQREAQAKVEEERRVREALAKAEEERRRAELAAKTDDERRQNEALARAEDERKQRESQARADEERRQKALLAKAEEDRRLKEQQAKADEARRQKEVADDAARRATLANNSRRKALVFGNDSYRDVPELRNARSDARAMSAALLDLGYAVRMHLDLGERDMKKANRDFITNVSGGDEVLFFFAGHGVQIGAANYLLPVDIRADDAASVRDEGIPLQRVLDDLNDAKARLTVAVIDACRDNPFKGSGRAIGGRGLAPTSTVAGQMVMFSAGAGQQALDSVGPNDKSSNGLFTRTFLKHVARKGVTVDRIMRDVRTEVNAIAKTVGHDQVPALYDQVVGDFYFSQ